MGRGSGEPTTALPSWAQRHLDEAGTDAPAPPVTTRHRRGAGRAGTDTPLRGWGVAALSVAAAVTAVPLAISAVANDRSDDPLPKVDTFTAGAPQALDGGQGGTTTRRGATDVTDPTTGGILGGPGFAPGAPAAAPAPAVVPVPQPAAVVRPTTTAPTTVTPRSATPTTTKPTTTTSDDDEGRSATPTKKPTSSSSGSSGSGGSGSSGNSSGNGSSGKSSSGSGQEQDGPVTGLVKGVGNTLGGVTGALGL
ncbi:hypothetical protein [Actinomycetospora soli]|uniref:hypothetical protein n=1 Tax=Actinomycetospora soli TaxID=2893887 RepID=UPI001E40D171|nr:hypothetical protein [Actinomycetospora soli]MCD2187478.1 hypothetical protein [Actinomycetospora soli]